MKTLFAMATTGTQILFSSSAFAITAPQGVTANPVSNTQVNLAWSASTVTGSNYVTSYAIYRNGVSIANIPGSQLYYNDAGLSPSTTYTYAIQGFSSYGSKSARTSVSVTTLATPVSWIITSNAFNLLANLDSAGAALAEQFFDNPNTYLVVSSTTNLANYPSSVTPTLSFTSYSSMVEAFNNGKVGPQIGAIIYDSENWSYTPAEEQQNLALYYQMAGELVHQYGLILIATPATDLVKALEPGFTGSNYDEYINLGIARSIAPSVDIFEIQAQGSEANQSLFTNFVQQAAAQAQAANPSVQILGGISTNPTGQQVTANQLYSVYLSTIGTVSGYWLNIPAQSGHCPSCGTPQPQVAEGLLQLLSP